MPQQVPWLLNTDENNNPIQGWVNPSGEAQSFQLDASWNLKTVAFIIHSSNLQCHQLQKKKHLYSLSYQVFLFKLSKWNHQV